MRRRKVIASATLCLLLAGTSLAVADRGNGRGDGDNDRGSKSEEKSKGESRRQHSTRRSEGRDGHESGREVVQTRRSDGRDWRESDREAAQSRREPSRDRYASDREATQWRREPSRETRVLGQDVMQRRESSRMMPERWAQERRSTDAHLVSRMPTPRDWRTHALRGEAQSYAWDGYRARRWQYEHRTWRARGGYQGYWIPDYRYRAVFGPRHYFRVDDCPLVVVSGYPRFYYAGYWVTFIDPWPEYWEDDWYAEDDCYVVHDYDGYYLTNVRHPGVRIAISFTLG